MSVQADDELEFLPGTIEVLKLTLLLERGRSKHTLTLGAKVGVHPLLWVNQHVQWYLSMKEGSLFCRYEIH